MINTVVFDIGGVLADYHCAEYYVGLGYDEEKAKRLEEVTMHSPYWCEYDRGVMTDEEIRAMFKSLAPDLSDDIDRSLTTMHGIVSRRERSIPWIKSLKERGFKVLVLSNYSRTAFHDCADALDFLDVVDGGIISYQDQVIKPNPAIYELLCYRYGVRPENCVFIDDTVKNLVAAAKLGFSTVHYETFEQTSNELESLIGGENEHRK